MEEKIIAGKTVKVNDDGYLLNMDDWTKEMAIEMAKEDGIDLTDSHFEVIEFLQKAQASGDGLTIRKVSKSGITDIKGLYQLFPGGPLKLSSKYAGIPKPSNCV